MTSKAKRAEAVRAEREIATLFRLAGEVAVAEPARARRYVVLARKRAERFRIPLRQYNRLFCRSCSAFFSAATLQVRTRPTAVVLTCKTCEAVRRVPKSKRQGRPLVKKVRPPTPKERRAGRRN